MEDVAVAGFDEAAADGQVRSQGSSGVELLWPVTRGSTLDVRYRVYSSEDNATYDEDVHSRRFCVYGTLAAPLGLTRTLDDGNAGILINLPGADDELDIESLNEPSRLKMRLLVFLEDEIISYRAAAITATHQVRLVGLRRGCYDTFLAAHAAGTQVAIIRRRDLHLWTSNTVLSRVSA